VETRSFRLQLVRLEPPLPENAPVEPERQLGDSGEVSAEALCALQKKFNWNK